MTVVRGALPWSQMTLVRIVIARSEARKQPSAPAQKAGLLRCARNDAWC